MKMLITMMLCLLSAPLQAAEWQAVQGDVVRVSAAGGEKLRLWCFGKQWPVKRLDDGRWQGWIGIDLKTKATNYPIEWSNGKRVVAHDRLLVSAGNFRISRIEVKKKMAEFDAETLARIRREVKALKATYTTAVQAAPAVHMAFRPCDGVESTPFGAQRYVNGQPRSPHSGIDIAAPAGTPIKAPLAGRVLLVADMYLNGNTVAIGHGNGLVTVYSHMRKTMVKAGDWIETGTEIGEMGATGRATGPHLHWGVRFNNARVNPASML